MGRHICKPFAIFKFVHFQLIQINTNLYIFLICLYMSFIHIMHDQNDYYFSKMIIKNTRDIALHKILGIMRYFNQKWGKLKIRRTAYVLAWMLWDKNTWSRNSKNHHSTVFIPSSETRLVQSLHHNTSHYITSHVYTYTHALYLNFSKIWIFPLMPSEWSPKNSTDHVQKVFPRCYSQRPLKSKILPLHPFPLDYQLLFSTKQD